MVACDLSSVVSESPHRLIQSLNNQFEDCRRFSRFYLLRGRAYGQLERFDLAASDFEYALLLEPENGEALIDYAEALYLSGAVIEALAVNAQIADLSPLPEPVKSLVKARDKIWRAPSTTQSHRLELGVGVSSNVNNGLSGETQTLTLGEDRYDFELEDRYRAKSGLIFNSSYHTLSNEKASGGTLIKFVGIDFNSGSHASQDSFQLTAGLEQPLRSERFLNARLQGRYQEIDGDTVVSLSARSQLAQKTLLLPEQTSVYGILAHRSAEIAPLTFKLGIESTKQFLWHNRPSELGVWGGVDFPLSAARAGGVRGEAGVYASSIQTLKNSNLVVSTYLSASSDTRGYSQLLNSNAKRWVSRVGVKGELDFPREDDYRFVISLGHNRQLSNIGLFERVSTEASVRLIKSW